MIRKRIKKLRRAIHSHLVTGLFANARESGLVVTPASKWLKVHAKQIHSWLITSLGGDYDDWVVLRVHEDKSCSISLWNAEAEFNVSFTLPIQLDGKREARKHGLPWEAGYIGAGLTNRAPRVGEHHRRGSDLYDGAFNEETWNGVVRDLLRCSLLRTVQSCGTVSSRKRLTRHRRTTRAMKR